MTSPVSDWALIIHADSGDTRVDVYWVDIRAGRLGLQLAREVKAWRRRDDLLTLGQRFRVVGPTQSPDDEQSGTDATAPPIAPVAGGGVPANVPAPTVPGDVPTDPGDDRRRVDRCEYLRGRVRAVLAHSEVAAAALQRRWPSGIPGLKAGTQSMDELDAITDAVIRVETDHSVPWYPEWNDPAVDESKRKHPSWSDRWANPASVNDEGSPDAIAARDSIGDALAEHPRSALISQWLRTGMENGRNASVDPTAVAHALYEFGKLPVEEWPDDDLTIMLDGSLRALGYPKGIADLGRFNPPDAPLLMSAAFAIAAGNAKLIYNDDGTPEVLTDVTERRL